MTNLAQIYLLTVTEQQELHKFTDENEVKGFIWKSTSLLASRFFVSKKHGSLRPVQDY